MLGRSPRQWIENSPASAPARLQVFAACTPGVEWLTAAEARGLGMALPPGSTTPGGVQLDASLDDVYRLNLCLRTAGRLLVRLGEFYAAAFSELRKKAARLPWEQYLPPGLPVRISVTCHKSRLYHSGAVAERVLGAIADRLGRPSLMVPGADDDASSDHPPQLVLIRLDHDRCTISIDSSGAPLHRRGYRLETAKAPLRETLAAAMLIASGWDRSSPLLDPFCGSGTIAIEAAGLAAGLPPGWRRSFAFMDWPGFNLQHWQKIVTDETPASLASRPVIQASDRDAGAIRIAQANAERAGVAEWIEISRRAVSAVEPPEKSGWVVTNPPYGLRVRSNKDLRDLYAQLGNVLRRSCPGWHVAILCSDVNLLAQTGLEMDTSFSTLNGGLNVRLGRGRVPDHTVGR